MEKLPLSLENDKLIDAVYEIRFTKDKETEVLFSNIYNLLVDEGFSHMKLPQADIPPQIRLHDSNLEFIHYYRFENNNYNVMIGPKVLALTVTSPYIGWESFKAFIIDKVKSFSKIFQDREVSQTSMRYINFFPAEDIFNNINISINDEFLCSKYTSLRKRNYKTLLNFDNDIELLLQIDNRANIKREIDNLIEEGSILDMDVKSGQNINIEELEENIENLHGIVKNTFFKIIKEEYMLNILKPVKRV